LAANQLQDLFEMIKNLENDKNDLQSKLNQERKKNVELEDKIAETEESSVGID